MGCKSVLGHIVESFDPSMHVPHFSVIVACLKQVHTCHPEHLLPSPPPPISPSHRVQLLRVYVVDHVGRSMKIPILIPRVPTLLVCTRNRDLWLALTPSLQFTY